jgi:hypothetical protein
MQVALRDVSHISESAGTEKALTCKQREKVVVIAVSAALRRTSFAIKA